MATEMKALVLSGFGETPEIRSLPLPEPGAGEVRVRIHAASVNGYDLGVAAGYMKDFVEHRFPLVLGKDFAGTVDAVGQGVSDFSVGDRVFGEVTKAYIGDGTFAEYVTVPVAVGLALLPAAVEFQDGGALSVAGTTARMIIDGAGVASGETVLIIGATGGVGTLAVQLAAQAGARVIATGQGEEARALLESLGASEVIAHTQGLSAQLQAAHPGGVDVVVHLAGDPAAALSLVRQGGRLASTLLMSADQLPSETVKVIAVYHQATRELLNDLAAAVADGQLRVPVRRTYPLAEAPTALRDFAQPGTIGKLVVIPG